MSNINVEEDNYGYLTFDTPKTENNELYPTKFSLSFFYPHADIPLSKITPKTVLPVNIDQDFLKSYCVSNGDGTRSLILEGQKINLEIGRRIINSDVPMLMIFLTRNRDIEKVGLKNNELNSAGLINVFEHVIKFDNISELDLRYNRLGYVAVRHLTDCGNKVKVKILRLRGNKIGPKNLKKLAIAIMGNRILKYLELADMDNNETSVTYFVTKLRPDQHDLKLYNGTLKMIDLSRPVPECMYSKFNSQHCAEIIGLMLKGNVTLEELYLRKYNFYCHDIEALVTNAKYNRTLKILDLSCNNIGDHGLEFLAEWLEKRPSLQYLLLGHNIITSHGIRSLGRAITSSNLLMLDVGHNRIDDTGGFELFHFLQKYPFIQHIRIFGNDLQHETAKVVKSMLQRNIFDEKNIDVKVYEIDGVLQFAYNEPQPWKNECK